jgi:amino acid permease
MKNQNLIGSLLFAGTIVGAGILGLPYALSQSGFIGGTLIFIVGTFFAYLSAVHIGTLVYLEEREVSLYSVCRSHLGAKAGYLTLAGILISCYGAMIAYPLAIGTILNSLLNIPPYLSVVVFIAFISLLLTRNTGTSNKFTALVTTVLVLLLVWVMFRSIPAIEANNYLFFEPREIFSAWGIIIFAFSGHIVIPSVLYYIKTDMKQGLRVLNIGLFLVAALYFFFFFVAIGVMGKNVTPVATNGLAAHLSTSVAFIGQVFAILALLTSAFGIGISLKLTFQDMFKINSKANLALIMLPVLFLDIYFSTTGRDAFINVLNYAGGIGSALYVGFIPALIVQKLARFHHFPFGEKGAILSLVFYGLAILYTLFIS